MLSNRFKTIGSLCLTTLALLLMACSPDRLNSNNTELTELGISGSTLDQLFQSDQYDYSASVGYLAKSVQIIAEPEDANASVTVNGINTTDHSHRVALDTGVNTVDITVTAANGRDRQSYSLTVTRDSLAEFAEDAYVKSLNTEANELFGYSVAVSDSLLVVSALGEASGVGGINNLPDESAPGAGAVYVFVRDAGRWIPEAYIKSSNPGSIDAFGISLALSGNTLAVGAHLEDSNSTGINSTPNDDGNADDSGAVYVFVRDDTGLWQQQAYIKASNTGADDRFGTAIDLDRDTLVVGANNEDSNSTGINSTVNDDGNAENSGAAYVFVRDAEGNWNQQAYIKASNAGTGDQFGFVALDGDTLAVGAWLEDSNSSGVNTTPNDDGGADNSGAVYIFQRDDADNWSEQAYIKASNPGQDDSFGFGIDISGNSLAVGAIGEDSETYGIDTIPNDSGLSDDSGAVYVFTRDGSNWTQQAYIKASLSGTTNELDAFGSSVAIDGDTLAVGAFRDDSSTTGINSTSNDDGSADDSGAAYVFTRDSNNTWSQQLYLKKPFFTEGDDAFGWSLDLAGDLLATGAYSEDSNSYGVDDIYFDDGGADNSGAVYVYQ